MLIDGEKVYLFNPYQIKMWTDEMIEKQVTELFKLINLDADSMSEISRNIEIYSNIQSLYGEVIARLTENYNNIKLENDTNEAIYTYQERKKWSMTTTEKAPSIEYFKALAKKIVKQDRLKENHFEADLIRFKKSSSSLENKMNALKKRQEAVRYEDFE